MAGIRAMAKHPRFSPCDQRGAGRAGRRAPHRPLNQENVLVWKQHSSLSAFMGEFLHTHAYHPKPCMSVSTRSTPLKNTTAFFSPSSHQHYFCGADGSLLICDWINGERCSLLQRSSDHLDCFISSGMSKSLARRHSLTCLLLISLLKSIRSA